MKINPTNTNFLDFLDIISGILTIKTFEISVNYGDTLIGTLEQLKELSKNTELFELKKFVFELNQKSNYEITDIEVMGYLKELTQNFEFQFVKAALFEIDVFENMVFNETMDERAREVYEKNKWERPIRKYKGFSNEIVSSPDYKKMRNKVFPHLGMQLYKAKKILKNELERSRTNSQQTETKTDKLKAELGKYGFFELPKVKQLSEQNKQHLIELISTNGLPYSIAMFEFLGFLKHIENEHFKTKYKLNKEVSKWFNSDKEGRAVKGNISTLSEHSKEDKSKYTAHTHKETVKTDYQKLK